MSTDNTEPASDRTVVIGLVADPGLPTHLANRLAGQLPDELSRYVSDRISWEIRVISEAVPLDANGESR